MDTRAKLSAALAEFLKREKVKSEIRRLFVIEEWSDQKIADTFNHNIRQGHFEGFDPPEGFCITGNAIGAARRSAKPPVARPVNRKKHCARRSAAVTLPHRSLAGLDVTK